MKNVTSVLTRGADVTFEQKDVTFLGQTVRARFSILIKISQIL